MKTYPNWADPAACEERAHAVARLCGLFHHPYIPIEPLSDDWLRALDAPLLVIPTRIMGRALVGEVGREMRRSQTDAVIVRPGSTDGIVLSLVKGRGNYEQWWHGYRMWCAQDRSDVRFVADPAAGRWGPTFVVSGHGLSRASRAPEGDELLAGIARADGHLASLLAGEDI